MDSVVGAAGCAPLVARRLPTMGRSGGGKKGGGGKKWHQKSRSEKLCCRSCCLCGAPSLICVGLMVMLAVGIPFCIHSAEKQTEASSLNEKDFVLLGKACVIVEKRECHKGKPCETYVEPERRRRLAQTKKEKKEEKRKGSNEKKKCQAVRWQYFFRIEPGAAARGYGDARDREVALARLDASALLRSERKHGCKGEKYVNDTVSCWAPRRVPADDWRCARPECVKLVDPRKDIRKLEWEAGTAAGAGSASMICGFFFAWACWTLFQYWVYAPERHFRDGPHGWQGHATFIPCVGFLKRPNYDAVEYPDPPPALVQLAPSPHPTPYVAQAPVVVLEAPPRVLQVAIPPGAAPGAVIHATAPTGERVAVTVPPNAPAGMVLQVGY